MRVEAARADRGLRRSRRGAAESGLPTFSPRLHRWFHRYLVWYLSRNLHGIRLAVDGPAPKVGAEPLVIYTNHPAWWDAIVFPHVLWRHWPERPVFGPMDAEALEKYRFFKRIGVFGVERGTRQGAATFLRTARAVLDEPGTILCLTAEGQFTDVRVRPVSLRPGLGHVLHRTSHAVVVPLAVEYTFWEERYPEALLRFGDPLRIEAGKVAGEDVAGRDDVGCSAEDGASWRADRWTTELERRLQETMDALAEDAKSRDPARFRTLARGAAGVGGVYDLWRRVQSWFSGRRFQASHGDDR